MYKNKNSGKFFIIKCFHYISNNGSSLGFGLNLCSFPESIQNSNFTAANFQITFKFLNIQKNF